MAREYSSTARRCLSVSARVSSPGPTPRASSSFMMPSRMDHLASTATRTTWLCSASACMRSYSAANTSWNCRSSWLSWAGQTTELLPCSSPTPCSSQEPSLGRLSSPSAATHSTLANDSAGTPSIEPAASSSALCSGSGDSLRGGAHVSSKCFVAGSAAGSSVFTQGPSFSTNSASSFASSFASASASTRAFISVVSASAASCTPPCGLACCFNAAAASAAGAGSVVGAGSVAGVGLTGSCASGVAHGAAEQASLHLPFFVFLFFFLPLFPVRLTRTATESMALDVGPLLSLLLSLLLSMFTCVGGVFCKLETGSSGAGGSV
mmetsp:Transcript_36661/g.68996  ORF Transcript_36661/g.68996 Transcript_36661/m.68996 type:complete len:322 (+) Transcript_36661:632-1597(+)